MNEAQEYSFDDIEIGQSKNFQIIVDEALVESFAKVSGDLNPLHMNEEYAKNTKFGKRICHGMLLASFFSRLVGMYLPGVNALYFSQNLNFVNPCYVGDNVTIVGEVIDKSEATKIIKLKTIVKDEQEEILVEGTAQVIVR